MLEAVRLRRRCIKLALLIAGWSGVEGALVGACREGLCLFLFGGSRSVVGLLERVPFDRVIVAIDPGKAVNRVWVTAADGLVGEPVSVPTTRDGIDRLPARCRAAWRPARPVRPRPSACPVSSTAGTLDRPAAPPPGSRRAMRARHRRAARVTDKSAVAMVLGPSLQDVADRTCSPRG
jgi:hypothetical protein